jgi:hypothetical protein
VSRAVRTLTKFSKPTGHNSQLQERVQLKELTMSDDEDIDPSKRVYVRDEQYGWLPAIIVEVNGSSDVLVRIDLPSNWNETTVYTKIKKKHMERWINLNSYHNHHLPLQNEEMVRDIAELPHLHEAAILYQIKERFVQLKPYTRVGQIIVAVNPCQWISELYTKEQQQLYAKHFMWQGKKRGAIIPFLPLQQLIHHLSTIQSHFRKIKTFLKKKRRTLALP